MNFDWLHYLVIAQEMFGEAASSEHKDANLRCAISRAYYSAFHHAKRKLSAKWNISVSESSSAHAQVQEFFKQMNQLGIARKLQRMRTARNKADYNDKVANLANLAEEVLNLAKDVIEILSTL